MPRRRQPQHCAVAKKANELLCCRARHAALISVSACEVHCSHFQPAFPASISSLQTQLARVRTCVCASLRKYNLLCLEHLCGTSKSFVAFKSETHSMGAVLAHSANDTSSLHRSPLPNGGQLVIQRGDITKWRGGAIVNSGANPLFPPQCYIP